MANYVLLERITVGANGASSISFNNIPQTGYTDLKLVCSTRTNRALTNDYLKIAFNSGSSYSGIQLAGSGSGVSSGTFSGIGATQYAGDINGATSTSNTFTSADIYIPNYTSSNAKSYSVDSTMENNATAAYSSLDAGLWSGTGAITTIALAPGVGTAFAQYSTFSLYALAAVGTTPVKAPKAIGGDIIQTDGTYWYHAFLSSGSFTPQTALSCDVLVVAGGGGGGATGGGGGGAGGLYYATSQALTANTLQAVVVGAGGTGGNGSSGAVGTNGGNSSFGSISGTIYGGGYGGTFSTKQGASGGSGGGNERTLTSVGGTGTSGQGNNGAAGTNPNVGGGGGGAAQAGNTSSAGYGGNGTYNSLTDGAGALLGLGQLSSGHYYFAGGGGAGSTNGSGITASGGLGGGANGIKETGVPSAATPNTGGGGGSSGTGDTNNGSVGGSGLVIIRYAY